MDKMYFVKRTNGKEYFQFCLDHRGKLNIREVTAYDATKFDKLHATIAMHMINKSLEINVSLEEV